jgi:hypothetical protein
MQVALNRAERCRALAEGCRRLAEIGLSTETQDHFSWTAEQYSSLADAEEQGLLAQRTTTRRAAATFVRRHRKMRSRMPGD